MASASTSSVVTAPEGVKRPARNPGGTSALPSEQLLELAEFALATLHGHLGPFRLMHGVQGQHHLHIGAARFELNGRRNLVGFDIRNEVRLLAIGEPSTRHDVGIDGAALRAYWH